MYKWILKISEYLTKGNIIGWPDICQPNRAAQDIPFCSMFPFFFNIQLYMIWHIGCKNHRFNNNFDLPKRHVPITTGEDIPLYLETTRQQAKTYHFYVKPPWSSYLCPKIQTLKQMFSGSFYQHLGYF